MSTPIQPPQPPFGPARSLDLGELRISPPRQRRTKQAWARVLDAGLALLSEGGYEAFTIAAVCGRARVTPRAIYDRAASKDALFLAVYEHGMERVRADNAHLADAPRWEGLAAPERLERAVRELADIFRRHADFLRPVMLLSGVNQEIYRRGAHYSREVGEQFTALMLSAADDIPHPDPAARIRSLFNTLFSSLVLRTMYGPGFAVPADNDETFVGALVDMAASYLLTRA